MSQAPKHIATAYLALGSNVGQRGVQLRQAIELLQRHPSLTLVQCSAVYQTKAWGPVAQAEFWNLCLRLEVDESTLTGQGGNEECRALCAEALLGHCLHCEQKLGRRRGPQRWGPRRIDIDLIDYARISCHSDSLDLPHPHFRQRLFVLVPLAEVAEEQFVEDWELRQYIRHLKAQNRGWGFRVADPLPCN